MSLIADNISCERNGRLVFSNISFVVRTGECAELRGTNGSGKSSLLRLLAGLLSSSAGKVTFDADEGFKTALHFIAHQDAIKNAMTVGENMQFWCDVLGGSSIAKALAAFELGPLQHEPAQFLSAGQRRRLTLSRLFLSPRPMWLLDEPMTALDQSTHALLRAHIRAHLKDNGIVIAATHGDLGILPHHTITLGGS
jgi:heme exporter protein A